MFEGTRQWASRALIAEERLRQLGVEVKAPPADDDFYVVVTFHKKDGSRVTMDQLNDARTRLEAGYPAWSAFPDQDQLIREATLG